MRKRLLATLLALCMALTLLPINALAAATGVSIDDTDYVDVDAPAPDGDDGRDETIPSDSDETPEDENEEEEEIPDADVEIQEEFEVEEWTYVPGSYSIMPLVEDGSSASDIVRVHVTATDKVTGEEADVEGAEVNLYVGAEWKDHAFTDINGCAEISLAGLTLMQRRNATVSASKVVSQGKAITGTARNALFNYFPQKGDESGEYYRYTLELHSEDIDDNGNWVGTEIPVSYETNKVDMVFAIDATGSMSGYINNVKNNVAHFAETLIDSGLDIRFGIIEYRDIAIGEETIVHEISGTHWMTNIDDVVTTLQGIRATGGGDAPETPIDALGYAADMMTWRSDAYRFAFVLTDAGYKVNNNYSYEDLTDITNQLALMNIVTSVITTNSQQSTYRELVEGTGGIFANVYSASFDEEMMRLSNSIIESVTKQVELELSEPRMLVNMSVCYFADDSTSQSESYRNGVKKMLNEYANRLAETTDGHVLLDKVVLFRTSNRLDFYDTTKPASMADIRIETEEKDDGAWWFNVKIRANARVAGFYFDDTYTVSDKSMESFENLKDGEAKDIKGKTTFYRIQLSGTEGANWNNSMLTAPKAYSTTVAHETGHYLFGFYDEYLNADGMSWRDDIGHRPAGAPGNFGLMDGQHSDIEMSKESIDYAYIGDFESADKSLHTRQSWIYKMSTESCLADILTNGVDFASTLLIDPGPYRISYTKGTKDRTATYSYATLENSDFIAGPSDHYSGGGGGGGGGGWRLAVAEETTEPLSENVSWGIKDANTVVFSFNPVRSSSYSVEMRKAGEDFSMVALNDSSDGKKTADLEIGTDELAEVRVMAEGEYNTYFIDRSGVIFEDEVYLYSSADSGTVAYVVASAEDSYTFVTGKTQYNGNGDYLPLSQATYIMSASGDGIASGEIYAVATYLAEIDYTTLQWFKSVDNGASWMPVDINPDTDYRGEENMNIGVRADLDGEGLYVLMAKAASVDGAEKVTIDSVDHLKDRDATVTIHLTDSNRDSKFYNVYYSESEFINKTDEGVLVTSFYADSADLTLALTERDRTIYVAVEVVLENGSRSELTRTTIATKAADSDDDGIPDWYCDEHLLWDKGNITKPVADRDADGDGLTNLEEYLGGSDPTDPNDPKHTTNIAVTSVSIAPLSVQVAVDGTATLTAVVLPENATNKNVRWSSSDESIVTVSSSGTGNTCTITGMAVGIAVVTVTTSDGGYAASVEVMVGDNTPPEPTVFIITFNANGGTVTPTMMTTDEEGKLAELPVPVRDGYTFDGWFTAPDGGNEITADTLFTEDTTVYAHWTQNIMPPEPTAFTIAFNANGGTVAPTTMTTDEEGKLAELPTPVRDGYAFDGWFTAPDGGDEITVDTMFTEDTTVYAHWTQNITPPEPTAFIITFDANGGAVTPTTMTTDEEGKLAELPTPVRDGYAFDGWFTALTGGDQVTVNTVFTSDATVYARWTYNSDIFDGNNLYPPADSTTPMIYRIMVPAVSGGTVNVSPARAKKDDAVAIIVTPDSGYQLDKLSATDSRGNELELTDKGHGKYAFTMPGSAVTVSAVFRLMERQPAAPAAPDWVNPFADVPASAWYYDAVKFVNENGLMNGISSTIFAPDANLSRAELAQILYNKEGKPSVSGGSAFTDAAAGAWYADAVTWAAANHIVGGYGNGLFGPDDHITREQLAVMLWRYAGEAVSIREISFSDADQISDFAQAAIRWAVENGILNGKGNNILDPKGFATRAEVAQMLKNYLDN